MKKRVIAFILVMAGAVGMMFSACSFSKGYEHISTEEAVELMRSNPDCMIVDVRTEAEYKTGHIPNAVLVPSEDIMNGKLDALPDKDQMLLLYCRTGRRAEYSSQYLVKKGYKNVYEFGGIVEWLGELEK